MRKCIIAILIVLTILNILVFAGSIPEDAVYDEKAEVFFAKLVSYRPNGEGETEVNLIPTRVIKGDIALGESVWYDEPAQIGDFVVTMGEEYLFLYFDENNPTCFFKTTSQDTKTLKLENTTGDMWDRLEEYFNEGKFEEVAEESQQKKALAKTEPLSAAEPDAKRNNKIPYYIAIGVALAVAFGGVVLKGKLKNGKNGNTED